MTIERTLHESPSHEGKIAHHTSKGAGIWFKVHHKDRTAIFTQFRLKPFPLIRLMAFFIAQKHSWFTSG
jgi:hypothetical protein